MQIISSKIMLFKVIKCSLEKMSLFSGDNSLRVHQYTIKLLQNCCLLCVFPVTHS